MIALLYNDLLEQVNNLKPETYIDISRVCYTINNIHKNLPKDDMDYHYSMIGFLMLHHKSLTSDNMLTFPYECRIMVGNKGILSTMDNLPPLLQKIISQYVINHSFK